MAQKEVLLEEFVTGKYPISCLKMIVAGKKPKEIIEKFPDVSIADIYTKKSTLKSAGISVVRGVRGKNDEPVAEKKETRRYTIRTKKQEVKEVSQELVEIKFGNLSLSLDPSVAKRVYVRQNGIEII